MFLSSTPPTRPLADPVAVHNNYLFSHDGFHPTSTMQARIAQVIHAALQAKYPAKFAASPGLSDREILVDVLGLSVSKGYDEYMAAAGVPAADRDPDKDPDSDGLDNIVEWILAGNDPLSGASPALPRPGYDAGAGALTLTWLPRYASAVYAPVTCQQSGNLTDWTDVPAAQITTSADGTVTARVPATTRTFLRLHVVVPARD